MEIQESVLSIFYVSRAFALAPYRIKRNAKGIINECKFSVIFCLYSVAVIVSLVLLTIRGIVNDAKSRYPVRMTTATAKFVTSLDVCIVVGACLSGVCCGLFGLRNTQEMNAKLREVDDVLGNNKEKEKRRGLIMMVSVFVVISFMLALDLGSRHIITKKKVSADEEVIREPPKKELVQIIRVPSINNKESSLPLTPHKQKNNIGTVTHQSVLSQDTFFVDRLASAHSYLGEAIGNVSSAFGVALLVMLVSCLLYLVATLYFLFVEILGGNDAFYTVLQFLWVFSHVGRLLLIVEPCHLTSVEARRTITLVCEIIRSSDPAVTHNLKKFWRQLLADRSHLFSACGMCSIDRQILTSYSSLSYYLAVIIADIPIQIGITLIFTMISCYLSGQPMEVQRILLILFIGILLSLNAQAFGLLAGSIFSNLTISLVIGSSIVAFHTVFSGVLILRKDVQPWLQWIFDITFLNHANNGITVALFGYERDYIYCPYRDPKDFLKFLEAPANISFCSFFIILFIVHACTYVNMMIKLRRLN